MIVLDETILETVESMFTDRQIRPNVEALIPDIDRNIQISTSLPGASIDEIHYELYRGKMELHFEGQYAQDKKITDLIDFLKDKIVDVKYQWEDWQYGYRCQWTEEMDDEQYGEEVRRFVDRFDGFINIFVEEQLYPFLKFEPKDDDEMSKQDAIVSVYEQKSLDTILKLNLAIPDYQRIYCWEDKNINDLWNSLVEIPSDKEYHLGAIILHKKKEDNTYNIIDGQQRLVTLSIILWELGYKEPTALLKECFLSEEARVHVANAKALIIDLKNDLHEKGEEFTKRLLKQLCFTVLLLTDDNLDLAYTFFSNQNSKGVPLSDYDLLKAHHLRYIYIEAEQEHLAQRWNEFTKNEDESHVLSRVLGTHLFRLRNWMRKRGFYEERKLRVKEEFSAAPIMRGIPPFGEKFEYYEKIQGGSHFFAYTDRFVYLYDRFTKTRQVQLFQKHLRYVTDYQYDVSNQQYGSVIETFLFAYYLKFGEQYLSEALFCIAGVMSQRRYDRKRSSWDAIKEYANNTEMVMMIDQATSPTFFLAEALPLIRKSGHDNTGIRERFYGSLQNVFNELTDFTDKTIINKRHYEYGK